MNCDGCQRLLSDRLDAPLPATDEAALAAHLERCGQCRRFRAALDHVRGRLRVTPAQPHRDVAASVRLRLEGLPQRGRHELLTTAAAFVLAFALAASAVGLTGAPPASADSLASLVLTGQRGVDTLQATVTLTEYGWHPDVPERRYRGVLRYGGAETLELRLDDLTEYPPGWVGNDVGLGVDEGVAWETGRAACPTQALPECLPDEPETRLSRGLEPFDRGTVVPLELIVPVDGFARTARAPDLGTRTVAGRPAVGAEVTAGHLAALLDPVLGAGAFRRVHPTDAAAVWLDAEYGIPLAVTITAARGTERQRWAAAHGYQDDAGSPVLELELADLRVNDPVTPLEPPSEAAATDGGFVPGPAAAVPPPALPDGMAPHRRGRRGAVEVVSWVDGRAWVKVRQHPAWDGDRLFGGDGTLVRRVALADRGVAYLADDGRKVLLHGPDTDIEVTGSVTTEQLLEVAASLDVVGEPVPRHWDEAATATLDEASEALPGLLALPPRDGFDGPGVRIRRGVVVLGYAGDGGRGVVVTQRPGERLTPPLDDVVIGVAVRDTTGRYTPARGELEWVEAGRLVTLRSEALPLVELLSLAEALEAAS